jgi:D-alanyl-D-alanine dipeptidase
MRLSIIPRFRILPALLLAILILSCSSVKDPKNPYGLDIISEGSDYLESVAANPDNELVDLADFIPNVVIDIRYADTNNFTGKKIYTDARAFARKSVAEALLQIQQVLAKDSLGLKIYDAYRPYSATLYFYEVYGDTTFVAAPWKGSIHNRGCAVDVSLVDLRTGKELNMPTPFDEFSERASLNYKNQCIVCDKKWNPEKDFAF